MKYRGNSGFSHSQADKIGVLITNLGTPQAPTKSALKTYLKEFLSDPRVVEVPRLLWWMILNGVILNIRPARSAKAYTSVWSEDGSPLKVHTQAQADALAAKCDAEFAGNVVVKYAMRYGQPSVSGVIEEMLQQGVRKLVVIPLYPQYSGSTVGSTFDAIADDFKQRRWLPELRFVNHYPDNPDYIQALANSIQAHWDIHGRADMLLFSYHGIPKRYLDNGDPYHCECYKTSRLVAQALALNANEYVTTFQSRFGREEWLKPYTDETLKGYPAKGIKSVQVVCPGFSADCLETIEEIGEENRDYFMEAGGERYEYIPALNSSPDHIGMLFNMVKDNIHGWHVSSNNQQRNALAKKLGAK